MLNMHPSELRSFLEVEKGFRVLDIIDLDWLCGQPRKILFERFLTVHKPVFEVNERIVLYSRKIVTKNLLIHIQKCGSKVDISNTFILLCAPEVSHNLLHEVQQTYSTDDCIFSTLELVVTDESKDIKPNPYLDLPESFCFSPWAHLEISSKGEFRPCCVYQGSITHHTDNSAYNISHDTIESVYQSKELVDLRSQFLAGQRPKKCSHCWLSESTVGYSNRTWLSSHLSTQADLLDIEKTTFVDNLRGLDIKMGNTCNFKCRICGPESSSKIAEEQWGWKKRSISLRKLNAQGRWSDDSRIWQALENVGSQLINIDFYGGEPFLVKPHGKFLEYLVAKGHAPKIRLHYNSNGSVYPAELFDKWQYFKAIDISFSIDDIGHRFEFQRGGKWADIEKNLNVFLRFRLPNMNLGIFPTLNVQNIYYLPDLIEWFRTTTFDSLVFNILQKPDFLSIMNMGRDLTESVIDRLSGITEHDLHTYNIVQIIDLLKQHRKSTDLSCKFKNYMLHLDHIRNQNFSQSHPEIAKIIHIGN